MFDRELALEILSQISRAAGTILQRFEPINRPRDFTDSPAGMEKRDGICMLLIAIGEGLKNLDKVTQGSLLPKYPQIDWKKAKGLRDILSHHYFDVNAEAIFNVCEDHVGELKDTVDSIVRDLASISSI
jgi:uncharacterized protein with HEPN domain